MIKKLEQLNADLERSKTFFFENIKKTNSSIHIYTHIDADGLTSGAILGKALYRANIPFQISVLRQLEKEEIEKIAKKIGELNNLMIFSDFGSGQYIELQKQLTFNGKLSPFLILDHHIPQGVDNKEDLKKIEELHEKTTPWHINPYFYGIDGSIEVSGAGICYYFAKCLNERNVDLSPIALVGGTGDIQNQGPNNSFIGLNSLILEDAEKSGHINVVNDLNFSPNKPLNVAIAYSTDIILPGLTSDVNKTLIFLQTLGILMENSEGKIKSLNNLTNDEKQKISTAIIEYASIKLNIEPNEIIKKLIANRYVLEKEGEYMELYDTKEYAYILNACGRTNNASLGIAIAMGDRKDAYQQAKEALVNYKKSLSEALSWIYENDKMQHLKNIQYFYGEDKVQENIIGTISSMLIFNKTNRIDLTKPLFGLALREDEGVYKISGRAHKKIVEKGINLSEAIREACELTGIDALGGGHPPAAGTKVKVEKIEDFLENINIIIKKQLNLN